MSLGTIIYTWLFGKLVAKDDFGNKYYCNSKNFNDFNSKRWVIFKNKVEASKIPPHWHAWLHKTINDPPINYSHKYFWQKDHQENKTGTSYAYNPNLLSDGNTKNIKDDKEYETWKP